MKTTIAALALLSIFSQSPALISSAHADGARMERSDFSDVSSFCRDRLTVLNSAYRKAELEAQNGNVANSAFILENGLVEANRNVNPRLANTLTVKAIRRGLVILDHMKSMPQSKQTLRSVNNFLVNYYLFVQKVSNTLDVPYFSSNTGFSQISNSNTQFERLFVDFAYEQVKMVLNTMTDVVREGRMEVIYPVGSTNLLLSALMVTTSAMANDLSESLFAARYACTINTLDRISYDISLHLAGQTNYDDFTAVQELVGATRNVVLGSRGCNDGRFEDRSSMRTTDALNRSLTLVNGTTQQVRLNGQQYIKRLIISAEGIRNDTMFEVVVNGEVKGTIYAPGRDPSYIVTIEDSADSIELVSRSGNAIISRILVVAQ